MHGTFNRLVLIVDDEEHIRNLLLDFFSLNGYETVTASNGRKALEILKDKTCSLMITDLQMPEMDGIELIDSIRNYDIPLKVIGMSLEDKESEFLNAGADHFLLKPFSFLRLKHILNTMFGK